MCGRHACTLAPSTLLAVSGARTHRRAEQYQPCFNCGPGSFSPVMYKEPNREQPKDDAKAGDLVLHTMKWGLIPSFTKADEKPAGYKMINARVEGLASSPVYRRLLSSRRCVVYTQGFFEWVVHNGKDKRGFFVQNSDKSKPLALAGLFDVWRNGDNEEPTYTFTILTTDSNEKLHWLHERMPVVLNDETMRRWVDSEVSFDQCHDFLCPFKGDLYWYGVAPFVNDVRNNSIDCLQSMEDWELQKKKTGIARFFQPAAVVANNNNNNNNNNKSSVKIEELPEDDTTVEIKKEVEDHQVVTLVNMGFGEDAARKALTANNNDVEAAMDQLLAVNAVEDGDTQQRKRSSGDDQSSCIKREKL